MVWDINKYRYTTEKKRKGRPIIFALALLIITGVIIGWVFRFDKKIAFLKHSSRKETTLIDLWNNQLYDKIIDKSDSILKSNQMNTQALIFKGFAYFYKAVPELSLEKKIPLLTNSIISLRRAKLTKLDNIVGEVDYILGKTYFLMGRYYYDLAIKYILLSNSEGFKSSDSYEYLGIAYTQLGDLKKANEYFNFTLKSRTSDILLLAIAKNYFQLNNIDKAVEYLKRAINSTKDRVVEEKCRFLLAEIYTKQKYFGKAEQEYAKILKYNPKSADAHYYLGEIYRILGQSVKARAEWREALRINPSHYAAKLRYYK